MEGNLNQYRIFYIVAKAGNISHAAEILYISQPAISKAISKLEQELGTLLFVRKSRGVTLTEEGRVLFEHLSTAFDAILSGEEKIRQINTLGIGQLKIGASATLCKYVLLPYLKGFIEKYPHIKISIECQSTYHTLKLLDSGKIDIALVVKPADEKRISFFKTGEVSDIFVSTKSYLTNLFIKEDQALKNEAIFESANVMLLDRENVSRQYIDDYFRENSIEPKHILEVSNMDLLIDFAKIGLGAAGVIREFVRDELERGELKEINLSKPIKKRTVGFAYLKNTQPTASLNNFIEYYESAVV